MRVALMITGEVLDAKISSGLLFIERLVGTNTTL
jgi:hypothetical protein